MSDFSRIDPPFIADEKTTLTSFLDYHRATLLKKIEGLSEADLIRRPTVSSLTLLSLVKHVAYVERWWFQAVFAHREVYFPWSAENPDGEMQIEPGETAEAIIEFFKAEVRKSREIVFTASLDDITKTDDRQYSLRWIVVHMLEEYARHNGHADFLREAIDGVTGE